jgi:antitoxin ParD1/3/4
VYKSRASTFNFWVSTYFAITVIVLLMPISADLGPSLETYVSELVESGRYNSKSEVIREGIRLVQEREVRFKVLDAAIHRGLDDAAQGRISSADVVFSRLDAKYRAKA